MSAEILTLPPSARLLKVVEKTVYTMAQNVQIPTLKANRQWRFKRADMNRWSEAQKADMRDGESS